MIASTILTGLSQFLGSEAGQRTVNEVIDRLHPEARVDAAIQSLPQLGPLPKGDPMADTTITIPVKTTIHPTGALVAVKTDAGVATVGIEWAEVLSWAPAVIEIYATGKAVWQARPAEERGLMKLTYVIEACVPRAMALARQIISDIKD